MDFVDRWTSFDDLSRLSWERSQVTGGGEPAAGVPAAEPASSGGRVARSRPARNELDNVGPDEFHLVRQGRRSTPPRAS
jgi:hypothetical protein